MFSLQSEIYSIKNLGKESFYFNYNLETEANKKIKDKEDLSKRKKGKILSLVLPAIFCIIFISMSKLLKKFQPATRGFYPNNKRG